MRRRWILVPMLLVLQGCFALFHRYPVLPEDGKSFDVALAGTWADARAVAKSETKGPPKFWSTYSRGADGWGEVRTTERDAETGVLETRVLRVVTGTIGGSRFLQMRVPPGDCEAWNQGKPIPEKDRWLCDARILLRYAVEPGMRLFIYSPDWKRLKRAVSQGRLAVDESAEWLVVSPGADVAAFIETEGAADLFQEEREDVPFEVKTAGQE